LGRWWGCGSGVMGWWLLFSLKVRGMW
jgi:hypothetical protein